ncbi:uncharacterized protein LOC117151526 [Bombus impatiens]|uniref:Uncharacterized protein LOC117151526 n=1 Tax=Bombus impatiens TaxID=132113 RepID=A0A6P8LMB9_BOMIM|nr:uncharacterized protein LOC117151526 [Bombus impatiens]
MVDRSIVRRKNSNDSSGISNTRYDKPGYETAHISNRPSAHFSLFFRKLVFTVPLTEYFSGLIVGSLFRQAFLEARYRRRSLVRKRQYRLLIEMRIFSKLFHHGKKKKKRHDLKKSTQRRRNYVAQDNFLLAGNQHGRDRRRRK